LQTSANYVPEGGCLLGGAGYSGVGAAWCAGATGTSRFTSENNSTRVSFGSLNTNTSAIRGVTPLRRSLLMPFSPSTLAATLKSHIGNEEGQCRATLHRTMLQDHGLIAEMGGENDSVFFPGHNDKPDDLRVMRNLLFEIGRFKYHVTEAAHRNQDSLPFHANTSDGALCARRIYYQTSGAISVHAKR
jgi:hypothetical protein